MEFEFPSTLTVLISFLAFLFMVVKLLKNQPVNSLDLIPGPKKLPLIGNLHLLIWSPLFHRTFRDLAIKYGALMHLQLGEVPFVIVSSVDVAKQVLKTHDITFANRPPLVASKLLTYNYTDVVLAPYGKYWRHLRKICTLELLSASCVQSFRPLREEENMILAQWIASKAGSAVNLSSRVYQMLFDIITRAAIGRKTKDQESVTASLRKIVELSSGLSIVDLYPSSNLIRLITGANIGRIFRQTDRLFDSIINQHIHRSDNHDDATEISEDLLDVLLKYQDDDAEVHLTNDNIKAVLLDIFAAGSDTSATIVEWAMSEMMKNPAILKMAHEEVRRVFDGKGNYVDEGEIKELKYLNLVIRETMRLHTPLPFIVPRYSSEKCEVNGYEIPAKTRVIINAWALGRDPNYWNDADKFMPERFMDSSIDYKGNNLEYIPFGAGRRMCPGMSFGMATVEYTLAMLLYHFDWEMPNGIKNEELDMTEAFGVTVTRKHELHLIPTVRRPLQAAAA